MPGKLTLVSTGDFVGVDLHVHTPASGCYKGPKNDEEYFEIIRRYVEKGVKVIAITDHNTVKGYKKINSVKQELENKIQLLSDLVLQHPTLSVELEKFENEYNLFREIVILPGVEFEAKPGIHMLLIFDPTTNLALVENLLENGGYSAESQGVENPGVTSTFDVLDLISEATNLGAIIIASHADSNKGIYNDLKGQYRAEVFRSSYLMGISYNSSKTREKIEGLYQQSEYKRKDPIAFVQCSDYHGGTDQVANCITYLKLLEYSFQGVYNALRNPKQSVSATISPKFKDLITEIANDPRTIMFESFVDNTSSIQQALVATLNNDYGNILVGVGSGKNIIGVKVDDAEITSSIMASLKAIRPSFPAFFMEAVPYEYGDRKVLAVFAKKNSNQVFYVNEDNSAYIFDEEKNIKKATPLEIANIMENSLIKRLQRFETINEGKITNLISELELLRNSKRQFALINKIERSCLRLYDIIDINLISPSEGEFNSSLVGSIGNGEPEGQTLVISRAEPRLPYAYLRCSAPRTTKMDSWADSLEKISGKAIIVAPGGGVYVLESEGEKTVFSLDQSNPVVVLTIKQEFKSNYSELTIAAWLKSSILLWYCSVALGDMNLHNPKILKQIPIPFSDILKPGTEIDGIVEKIIGQECALLKLVQESAADIDLDIEEDRKIGETIELHNQQITSCAREIDQILHADLGLVHDELETVIEFYTLKDIFSLFNELDEEEEEEEGEEEGEEEIIVEKEIAATTSCNPR